MSNPRITAPESESDVLATVYRHILDCYERKQRAAEDSGGEDDPKEDMSVRTKRSLPRK